MNNRTKELPHPRRVGDREVAAPIKKVNGTFFIVAVCHAYLASCIAVIATSAEKTPHEREQRETRGRLS